jgi:hypothetical protein
MSSPRGRSREDFPVAVTKLAFARCCREGTMPGVPQCEKCGCELKTTRYIFEHVQADGLGGRPTEDNCKVYCYGCASIKTTDDNERMSKADRVFRAHHGLKRRKGRQIKSRGFQKAEPQRNASRPIGKWKGYER